MRFFIIFLLLLVATGPLHAQLIMKENFMQCGNLTGQGWTAFTNQNQNPVNGCVVGLNYSGYAGSGLGNSVSISQVTGEGVERVTAATLGNVYAGFLINVGGANTSGGLVLSFNTNGSAAQQNSGFTLDNNHFGLTNNGVASYETGTYNTGTTYLIVLKLTPTGTYSLFINPTLGAGEPAADVTVTPGGTPTLVYGFRIHQRNVMQGQIDGIRVGQTWGDIVGGGAGAGLLMTESFSMGGGLSSNGWTAYNGCCIGTTSNNLTYPGYASGGGSSQSADLNGSNAGMFKSFLAISTGTVYASFLVDVQNFGSNPMSGTFNFYSSISGNAFNYQQGFITDNSGNKFGLRNSVGGTAYAGSYGSSTFLVVIGYDVDTDMYSMWVNPPTGQTSPPGAAISNFASGSPVLSVDGISITDNCCNQIKIGEIHVSTNWADVVTYAPPTEQPTNLLISSAGTSNINGTLTMISGGGSYSYLVVRSATPLVGAPANGVNYSIDQPIGNGFAEGNFCCGSFGINSGLTSGTLYYLNFFANTTGNHVYNTTAPLQGIVATELSNGMPGNPTFSNIQDTQMDVSFTAAPTPGAGYVAFRRLGGGSPNPQNGLSFEVGDVYNGWTVVYKGTGTSFTDTGLSAQSNYSYEIYTYSGVPSYENYFDNPGGSSQTTIAASPTAQPTVMTFSDRNTSSITVSFTAATGSPSGYILIGRPSTPPLVGAGADPVDGIIYNPGSAFPAGGSGAFVAAVGSGTTFNINSLTANTQYFFNVYSYNGSGVLQNYLQTPPPLVGAAFTLFSPKPNTQPTSIGFNTIGSTSFNVTFNAAAGSPTGYIALRRAGTTGTETPVDGTVYTAGDPIGASTVAYIGTTAGFSESGLTGNTTYYYRIFAYNQGSDATTINFKGGGPLAGNQATLVSVPTAIAATPIAQTSFTALWNSVTGATGYRLDVATSNTFGGTILAGYNDLSVPGASQSVTGLTAGTTYYYRVRAVGAGGTTVNSNVITTATIPPNPVASAGTSITTTSFQANWSAATGATGYRLDVANDSGFSSILGSYNNLTVAGISQSVSGLTPGNTYYYRVRAVNASGTSGNSATITVLLFPPAPVTVTASGVTNAGFTANWNVTNGAATYRLDVDDDSGFGSMNVNNLTVAGTSSAVGGLNSNTTYYYRVRAFNATGTSANSSNATVKTATDAPVATAGTAMTASSFTANWGSVSGATNYSLDVANDAGFTSILGGYNNLAVASTSQSVTGLTAGNTYYYRVRANNPSASPSSTTITVLLVPPAPVAIAATSPSVTDFTANWNGANGAASYNLDVSTASDFSSFFSTYNNMTVSALFQTVIGLTSGVTYYYRVQAVNTSGPSSESNVISISALPPGPVANAATAITNTSFSASWSTVGGSDFYGFEVSSDNFVSTLPDYGSGFTTTTTSQSVSGLTPGGTYQYRARAHNVSGFSNYSNEVSLTLLADVPVATAATAVSSTGFTANWNAAAGAASYLLDVSLDNFASLLPGYPSSETSTSKAITGLTPGATYHYRVRAVTTGGETVNSINITVLLAPDAPVATAATAITRSSFTANWSTVSGATEYFVDVGTDNPLTSFVTGFNNKSVTDATSLPVDGLSPGTTYYYQVRSSNASGASGNSSVITSVTVTDPPTSPAAEQIAPDGFLATWNPIAGAAGYKIDVSKDNFATFATGYDGKDVGNITEEFVTGLLSSTLYRFRVRAYNSASFESANSVFKSVRTAGGVVTTPQITNIEFLEKFSGSGNDKIKVTLSGGEGEKTLRFFRRSIQTTAYTIEDIKPASQLSYEFTVEDAWLDKTGLEFYFRFEDEINQSTESTHQFIYRVFSQEPIPNLTAGGTLESYRIFSVPVKLDDNSISEVFKSVESQFGGYDKTKWRLVRYEGGRNVDYTEGLNKIDQGKGYWFNAIENVTVKISGSVIPTDQSNPFQLALESGWTQVGNPFPFDISWVDVLALNNNPAGVGKLYTYDANNVSFKESGGLRPWEGGFVKSDNAITVSIPVTVKQSATGRLGYSKIENHDLSDTDWIVPFTLKIGKSYNQMAGIGMHTEAKPGNDRFDEQSLPRFIKYLELNSYHKDYFLPRFTRDVVPSAASHNWEYTVESNFDENNAVLTWDNKSLGDNEAQLLLYDADENMLIDMKAHGEYRFTLNEKHELKFFFSADGKSLSPDITGLGRPYPNPATSSIAIPFIAGMNSSEIQIVVFDMMGRQVKSVVNQRFEPGMHEASWDGNDEQGARVAQGVYIYRLTSNNTPAQQGRIVMK